MVSKFFVGKNEVMKNAVTMYMNMTSSGRGKDVTWRVRSVNGIRWHQCMYCTKVGLLSLVFIYYTFSIFLHLP